jgi:hypothetical protein
MQSFRKDRNATQRAERLFRELGDRAYQHARRSEREATNLEVAACWRRVALIVANRSGHKVGLGRGDADTRD